MVFQGFVEVSNRLLLVGNDGLEFSELLLQEFLFNEAPRLNVLDPLVYGLLDMFNFIFRV